MTEKYKIQPKVGFIDSLLFALKEKFCHDMGRSRRSEFWWYTLFYTIAGAILSIAEVVYSDIRVLVWIVRITNLYLFVAFLLVLVRRLHDTNHSGYWSMSLVAGYFGLILMNANPWLGLLSLIPLPVIIYFGCLDSDKEENDYGESTKYVNLQEE